MISFVPGYFGHLGNQMFQYAATRALSLARDTECGWPAGKQPNLYDLFPLQATRRITSSHAYPEPHFHFDARFFDQPDGTMLSGYFQTERYFQPWEHVIRKEFPLPFPGSRDAVSVHVRRGDYLSFPEHHPPCNVDYYREAMGRFPGAHFMAFSDDPGWCLLNLKPLGDVEIITGNPPLVDMHMMAQCRGGHIIANSSFSWWGAWLDPNPHKKVIAPGRIFPWFGPAKAGWRTDDLLPESWERI